MGKQRNQNVNHDRSQRLIGYQSIRELGENKLIELGNSEANKSRLQMKQAECHREGC